MSNSPQLTGASTWPLSQLWLVLLAALPILTALASFQTDGEFANWQLYARQLWLPTQIFEIATIILALTLGASFWRPLASSSKPVQLLVGHGGNQFRLLVPAARKNFNQPHNSLLQFIFDWGVIGAGALIALLIILGLRVIAITKEQPLWLPSCLAATSMAIFSLIDGVFYYNLPIILFLTFSLGPLMIATMRANPTTTADRSNSAVNVQRYRQRPI